MTIFFLSVLVVGLAMLIMAVGVIFSNRCLRGSCGGEKIFDSEGKELVCDACPHRVSEDEALVDS
jgi:hypothetical protein